MKSRENFFEICALSQLNFQPMMVACARHDGHGFTTLKMEVVMEKRNETEELIDLGAVAVETRGPAVTGQLDDPNIPFQCRQDSLSAD